VESLLQPPPPPPPPPPPVDAGLENSDLLMGQPAVAFAQQNHQAHVDAHRSLFLTDVVKQNPALQGSIMSHMMQHLQFLASELAQEQMPPEVMQQMSQLQQAVESGQADPQSVQPMMQELQMISDKISAPILAQLTQDLLLSIGQGTDEDPLVKIRQQELELRKAELDEDNRQFDERENTRREGQLLENEIAKQRIATTKQVADDKLDLAITRLQQQADIKLSEMQAKFGGQR